VGKCGQPDLLQIHRFHRGLFFAQQ
jgi:hypothetical protein